MLNNCCGKAENQYKTEFDQEFDEFYNDFEIQFEFRRIKTESGEVLYTQSNIKHHKQR